MGGIVIALAISVITGVVVQAAQVVQVVVPQGIESVNGSDVTMECTSPLVDIGGSVMVCSSGCSTLLDGISLTIDTSTSDWASQLVTVRRTEHDNIPYTRVLLTFGFDTAVTVTRIELDLFLCPEWNIGAPSITVYANRESNLYFSTDLPSQTKSILSDSSESSCDSLSTVTITLRDALRQSSFLTWHILMSQFGNAEWAHIGEVRFLGADVMPNCAMEPSTMTSTPISSSINPTTTVVTSFSESFTLTIPSISPIQSPSKSPPPISYMSTSSVSTTAPSSSPTETVVGDPPTKAPTFTKFQAIITAAGFVGLLVMALVILVVVCCCVSKRRRYILEKSGRTAEVPRLHFKPSSLNSDGDDGTLSDSPAKSGFPSPFHVQYDVAAALPPSEGEYEDTVSSQHHTLERVEENEYGYAYVTLAEAKDRAQFSIKQTEHHKYDYVDSINPSWSLRRPFPEANLKPKKVESPTVPAYGNIKAAPASNTAAEPSPHDVIISDNIDLSDFANVGSPHENEGDDYIPKVFGPIYPILSSPPDSLPPVEIAPDKVIEVNEGAGRYGNAVLAITRDLSLTDLRFSETNTNRNLSILLALKKFKPQPSKNEHEGFIREVKFMSLLNHSNVVRFIGVCYQDPAFIVMEYMEEGDLNQFLQRFSEVVTAPLHNTQIATFTLVYMASQIASGMKHLAKLGFIHRDLATRKCFVGKCFSVKLADFGTNSQYQSHYCRISGNVLLPIRWMATECFYGKFSEKTDVWAFGVTMWELFTLAKDVPYPHLSDKEVIDNATKINHRRFPSKPAACPQSLYHIMGRCWRIELNQRANFAELHEMLNMTLQELK